MRSVCLGVGLALLAGLVSAEETVTVSAGKRSLLGGVGVFWDEVCTSGGGNPRVTAQPAHGRVEIVRARLRNSNRSSSCFGVPYDGYAVYYTPRGGYRGADTFAITMDVHNGWTDVPDVTTYRITIR